MPGFEVNSPKETSCPAVQAKTTTSTTTNTALLVALQNTRNDRVWTEFCSRYRPVLESFAQRLGLSEHEAQDAAQDTLSDFARAYKLGKYDRDRGRLRTWLYGIARKKIADIQRQPKDVVVADKDEATAFLNAIPDDRTISKLWETQWHRAIARQCMKDVRGEVEPRTMQAFELFVLKEWPADKVASHIGVSRNAVYQAKRHVLTRMRDRQKYWEENW